MKRMTAALIFLFIFMFHGSALASGATQTLPRLSEIYPNGTAPQGSTKEQDEYIEIYNPSSQQLDLENFIIKIKESTSKNLTLSGFTIEPYSYQAIPVSNSFALVNGGGTVQLWYAYGEHLILIEEVEYSSGATEEQSWSNVEDVWILQAKTPNETNELSTEPGPVDVCPNTQEIETDIPDGHEIDANGNCAPIELSPPEELENRALTITELFPNPLEDEDSNEFIELYNPHDEPIGLDGYILYTGNSYDKPYTFSGNLEIGAKQYLAFYSSEINITLANSGSRARLVAPAGNIVSETESYSNSKDEMSWSLFEGEWKFSEKATPDAENEYVISEDSGGSPSSGSDLKPCRPDQFRNPETNRCKLKSAASSSLQACATDQYRNPETNRCRKVGSGNSSLAPCKPGQYRSPETNRCRKIESSSTPKPCQAGYERNSETNRCRKATSNTATAFTEPASINPVDLNSRIVAILIMMAGGYALYEYRTDIGNFINRLRNKRGDPRPPG